MISFRWHIPLANFDPVIGSEQGKSRPVLVISEVEINRIPSIKDGEIYPFKGLKPLKGCTTMFY